MPRFDDNDVSFEIPEGWVDRSCIVFEAPTREGEFRTSVSVQRPPEQLEGFVQRRLARLSRLPSFEFKARGSSRVGGLRAEQLLFEWEHPERGPVTQRLTLIVREDGSLVLVTDVSATSEREAMEPRFDAVLASFTARPLEPPTAARQR